MDAAEQRTRSTTSMAVSEAVNSTARAEPTPLVAADMADALLHASGLSTVLAVTATMVVANSLPKASPAAHVVRPLLIIGGIDPSSEADRWRTFWNHCKQKFPDASAMVRPVQHVVRAAHSAPQFAGGAGAQAEALTRKMQASHTRCVAPVINHAAAPDVPADDDVAGLALALSAALGAAGGLLGRGEARLIVVAVVERWVRSGALGEVEHAACLQLEGFAPMRLREVLSDAAATHMAHAAAPSLRALGPVHFSSVTWHASDAQAALCDLRWRRAAFEGQPPPRDPSSWLAATERLCSGDGGLLGLLDGRQLQDSKQPLEPAHGAAAGGVACSPSAFRRGHQVLSRAAPRLEFYPHFLSDEESDHLLMLALAHAQPTVTQARRGGAATSGPGGEGAGEVKWRALLPAEDPVVLALEQRCAEVTGVPLHADERPLDLKLTAEETSSRSDSADGLGGRDRARGECVVESGQSGGERSLMPSLHVDTNNGGTYRCATVIIYLNELPSEMGGETRMSRASRRCGPQVVLRFRQAQRCCAGAHPPRRTCSSQPQRSGAPACMCARSVARLASSGPWTRRASMPPLGTTVRACGTERAASGSCRSLRNCPASGAGLTSPWPCHPASHPDRSCCLMAI